MKEIKVERTNERPLRFVGELLATVSSSPNNAHPDYSGSPGRWTTLALYETASGRYVCTRTNHTAWDGEHDQHEALVVEGVEGVMAFFDFGRIAMILYEQAGLDVTEEV